MTPSKARRLALAGPIGRDDVIGAVVVHIKDGDLDAVAGVRAVVGEEAMIDGTRSALESEDLDVRSAARPRSRHDLRLAIAVQIPGGHLHAPTERRIVGEHVEQDIAGLAVNDGDARSAAHARADNNVRHVVAVIVGGGDAHALDRGIERMIGFKDFAVIPAQHLDHFVAVLDRADDQIGLGVAVKIGGCHRGLAAVGQVAGEEVLHEVSIDATENFDAGTTSSTRADDEIISPVSVHVADGDPNAPRE